MTFTPIAQPIIGQSEIEAVTRVLKSGQLASGPQVAEFEEELARYCGSRFCIAFNSGTAAIHAGLYALDIQPGDEVVTTPFTFAATANPALALGAKVIFADIDPGTYLIDPLAVNSKLTPNTKVIIPVDLYGSTYDHRALARIVRSKKVKILEDACQSIGATSYGKRAGNLGDIGTFSFYATKNMMCGEGGAAITNSSRLAEKMRRFRHHGQSLQRQYQYFDYGLNYRMLDITAAIARVQLTKLETWNKERQQNASILRDGLISVPNIILPIEAPNTHSVYHQFTVRITRNFPLSRSELIEQLKQAHIGSGIYYPMPLHLFPQFKRLGYKKGDFPNAEQACREVISLPIHPQVTQNTLTQMIDIFKKAST